MAEPEIVIVVEGGAVVNVVTRNKDLKYRIIDIDQIKCGEQSFGVDYGPDETEVDIEKYSKEIIEDALKEEVDNGSIQMQ